MKEPLVRWTGGFFVSENPGLCSAQVIRTCGFGGIRSMTFKFSRLAALGVAGFVLAAAATAYAQCDPWVCANPYSNMPTALAPRTFTTLKAAKVYCQEPIVWRDNAGGKIYAATDKGYGTVKPGFYMCKSHAQTVARINAASGRK